MPKKIYVEHLGHEDGPHVKVKKKIIREFDDECCGGDHGRKMHKKVVINDECCGEHKHKEHKHHEFREFKEHKGHHKHKQHTKRHHVHVRPRFEKKMKTKMFTTRESLVEYVNEVGELGHAIDVFEISEGLFKVVVVERVEVKKDVEVEIKESPEQEIELEVEIEEE